MTGQDPFYWRSFNVLMRLLGIGATFAGSVVATSYGLGIPAQSGVNPATEPITLAVGTLVALLGLGFLMLPPFRPDQGDTTLVVNPFRALTAPRRRRWWTGDPIGW